MSQKRITMTGIQHTGRLLVTYTQTCVREATSITHFILGCSCRQVTSGLPDACVIEAQCHLLRGFQLVRALCLCFTIVKVVTVRGYVS